MQIGIDSYSFHRFFGETYPGIEADPGKRLTVWDFLDHVVSLGVGAVSLESAFLDAGDTALIDDLRRKLDAQGLERVWAWGHPRGFRSGQEPAAMEDARRSLRAAQSLGAGVMRICAGGRGTRMASWPQMREALLPLLSDLTREAQRAGVVLAVENHIDLFADELLDLVESIGSPYFGICLDTANNLRMYENPREVLRKLAPHTKATHIKDIIALGGDPGTIAFWPSVATGEGLIDMAEVVSVLRGVNYGGVLAIEIDYLAPGQGDEFAALARSVTNLRRILDGQPALPRG
ncbi:sugar phosphate isomerase/epimerase family protein [Gemmobacter serpentinus]|uniref:sugar phosphate isomerase/epimerase family protein n=1 Tax=Gemmobacter serpentinus TaxID=2652247 RepID=UPI00124F0AED|nr:sugar phosphate isomerase/epimerase family protein [Gemmobacter serpentinus]